MKSLRGVSAVAAFALLDVNRFVEAFENATDRLESCFDDDKSSSEDSPPKQPTPLRHPSSDSSARCSVSRSMKCGARTCGTPQVQWAHLSRQALAISIRMAHESANWRMPATPRAGPDAISDGVVPSSSIVGQVPSMALGISVAGC